MIVRSAKLFLREIPVAQPLSHCVLWAIATGSAKEGGIVVIYELVGKQTSKHEWSKIKRTSGDSRPGDTLQQHVLGLTLRLTAQVTACKHRGLKHPNSSKGVLFGYHSNRPPFEAELALSPLKEDHDNRSDENPNSEAQNLYVMAPRVSLDSLDGYVIPLRKFFLKSVTPSQATE